MPDSPYTLSVSTNNDKPDRVVPVSSLEVAKSSVNALLSVYPDLTAFVTDKRGAGTVTHTFQDGEWSEGTPEPEEAPTKPPAYLIHRLAEAACEVGISQLDLGFDDAPVFAGLIAAGGRVTSGDVVFRGHGDDPPYVIETVAHTYAGVRLTAKRKRHASEQEAKQLQLKAREECMTYVCADL